jgi:hypothetical protein
VLGDTHLTSPNISGVVNTSAIASSDVLTLKGTNEVEIYQGDTKTIDIKDGKIAVGGNIKPSSANTINIGNSSAPFKTVYASKLNNGTTEFLKFDNNKFKLCSDNISLYSDIDSNGGDALKLKSVQNDTILVNYKIDKNSTELSIPNIEVLNLNSQGIDSLEVNLDNCYTFNLKECSALNVNGNNILQAERTYNANAPIELLTDETVEGGDEIHADIVLNSDNDFNSRAIRSIDLWMIIKDNGVIYQTPITTIEKNSMLTGNTIIIPFYYEGNKQYTVKINTITRTDIDFDINTNYMDHETYEINYRVHTRAVKDL